MIMKGELGRIRKEAVMAYFNHLPEERKSMRILRVAYLCTETSNPGCPEYEEQPLNHNAVK
jgi:hypothetical protein